MDGLKNIGNVHTGIHKPTKKVKVVSEEVIKPKKIPNPKNQFKYQFDKVKPLVLERDNHACKHCGSTEYLEVNHIVPKSKGGTNDMGNLETLCDLCHAEEHKDEPVYNIMMKRIRDRRD